MFGQPYRRNATLDLRQLYQGVVWTDADGVTHQIEDMDEHYIMRVLGYLRRNAERLDLADVMSSLWAVPPDRYYDWEDEVCERDSHEWIEELEVVQAMKRRLARYEVERRLQGTIHNDYMPAV